MLVADEMARVINTFAYSYRQITAIDSSALGPRRISAFFISGRWAVSGRSPERSERRNEDGDGSHEIKKA